MFKKILPTVLYYLLLFAIHEWLKKYFRSGPCTPNLDMLGFILALLISFVPVIKNLIFCFRRKTEQSYLFITLLHIAGIILLLTIL